MPTAWCCWPRCSRRRSWAAWSSRRRKWLAVVLLLLLGVGWIIALTTLNGVAQAILPNWVRGRGLAVYLTVFNGAMAAGSLGWGLVAQQIGVPMARCWPARSGWRWSACVFHRVKLPAGEADLQPSNHWPEPLLAEPVAHDRGPVMIQVEYRIRKEDRAAFLRGHAAPVAGAAARRRLCLGHHRGHRPIPSGCMEWFLVESWAEHLRQHHRVSQADADLQAEALRFHIGPGRPEVHHFLAL